MQDTLAPLPGELIELARAVLERRDPLRTAPSLRTDPHVHRAAPSGSRSRLGASFSARAALGDSRGPLLAFARHVGGDGARFQAARRSPQSLY